MSVEKHAPKPFKHYKLGLGTTYPTPHFTITTPPKIYVNWAVDIICLIRLNNLNDQSVKDGDSIRMDDIIKTLVTNGLRYLAIDISPKGSSSSMVVNDVEFLRPKLYSVIPRKGDLQELVLFSDAR